MDPSNYSNFEVMGVSIDAYAKAFRQYPTVLEKYFARYGVTPDGKLDDALLDSWLSMEQWLRVTNAIVEEVGASTVYSVGKRIPDTALIPPEVQSAADVLQSLDTVYHMHHRKDGVVMFDPQTGTMLDGIGNYVATIREGGSSAEVYCDNPYPCDLDRGILAGFAGRFEPAVSVTHASSACRKKGADHCTYLVQW